MLAQFLSKLSQNYIELLADNEYYDITIEVGEDPNIKIFRAHMNILYYRSPFLRRALDSNKKNNNGVLTHIKLPNISPEIFQIILKYIYSGILSLNEQDISDILKVMVAANELGLQEIVDYLQKYLIESKSEWMEQHFAYTQRISLQCNNLLKILKFILQGCANILIKVSQKDKINSIFKFVSDLIIVILHRSVIEFFTIFFVLFIPLLFINIFYKLNLIDSKFIMIFTLVIYIYLKI